MSNEVHGDTSTAKEVVMPGKSRKGIGRREFIKVGMVGTTSALLGGNALAEVVQQYAATAPDTFPDPVYRTLGRTGLKVTVVSFGAMLTPEPEVIRVALDHGVNYIDTARKYMSGRNEQIVAQAIKGRRDKVILATKTLPDSKSVVGIIQDVEASLRALKTDYIDVIQLHNLTDRRRIFIPETREALLTLKKQGKVRFCGVTTHKNQVEVLNALVEDKEHFFDTCLVSYNFKTDQEVGEAINRAAKAGIGIVAMKSQAGGYQTQALGAISSHQAALKWVLQNPNVTAAIPGMKDMAQLKENIAVMGMPFKYADRRILERYAEAVEPYFCTLCGSCEKGCPRGVEISTINRALMYADGGYRSPALARETYREIRPQATASACIDCSSCRARCVNGLDIAAKMARARNLLA
jgi:uncharacterized protein